MIIGVITIHDDHDILERCFKYHINSGVKMIGVVKHQSTPEANDIIHKYKDYIPVILDIKSDAYQQHLWLKSIRNQLIDRYRLSNTDWVVHFDADEFWTDLNILDDIPDNFSVVRTKDWTNYNPHNTLIHDISLVKYVRLHTASSYQALPKVALRANKSLSTRMGNHRAIDNDNNLINESHIFNSEIEIDHFPIRTLQQLISKTNRAKPALKFREGPNDHRGLHWDNWLKLQEHGKLEEWFMDLLNMCDNKMFRNITDIESNRLIEYSKLLPPTFPGDNDIMPC